MNKTATIKEINDNVDLWIDYRHFLEEKTSNGVVRYYLTGMSADYDESTKHKWKENHIMVILRAFRYGNWDDSLNRPCHAIPNDTVFQLEAK